VGTAVSTPSYNFEVLTSAGSPTYASRFQIKNGGELRYTYSDQDVGGAGAGPGSWLTQKSGTLSGPGGVWSESNIFAMIGGGTTFTNAAGAVDNRGLSFWCFSKPLNGAGTCAIYSGKNDVYVDVANKLYVKDASGGFWSFNNGTWNTGSDSSLKRSIVEEATVMSKIAGCRPVTYKWKDQPTGPTHHGFIAQDIEKIFPELVSTLNVQTGIRTDETLGPQPILVEKKTVDYIGLVSVLLKAIQEQQAQISNLQSRVDALEHR
jgi:hypothetical protein